MYTDSSHEAPGEEFTHEEFSLLAFLDRGIPEVAGANRLPVDLAQLLRTAAKFRVGRAGV